MKADLLEASHATTPRDAKSEQAFVWQQGYSLMGDRGDHLIRQLWLCQNRGKARNRRRQLSRVVRAGLEEILAKTLR
jgi:hypothetical protein